jgi:hypothetical protein
MGGQWSASQACHFTSRESAPGTHWTGGWVGPVAGLDDTEKRRIKNIPISVTGRGGL